MLMCPPFNLTFLSLLLIGFHSIRHFSRPFLRMMATPSWCSSSSLPEYSTVSPVLVLCQPEPVHLLSLIPRMCRLLRLISAVACASFPVSYIILTLHLALKTSIFLSAVSFRLLLLSFILVSFDNSESPSRSVVLIFFVAVSVTWVFYGTGLLALCPNP